jgi:AcrR family transcriptional regulator
MRQQRPRGSTTREAVVNAAMDVLDRVGVGGLTIRAVASAVGAPPMSLYTHFANKEQLMNLAYGELAHRLYVDAGHDTWQAELMALAERVRATLLEHPSWTPLLSRPAPPMRVAVRDRILKMMVDAGMSSSEALQALSAAVVTTIGLVLVELTFRDPDGGSSFVKRFARNRALFEDEPGPDSTSREAFTKMQHFDHGETFRYALTTMLEGLSLKASQASTSTPEHR